MSSKTNPEPVGSLLRSVLVGAEATYADEAHRLWEVWPRAVGPDVARRATPKHFHRGVLTVTVGSSPWLHQLSLLQDQIRQALDRELGARIVFELRFRLGTVGEPTTPPAPPPRPLPELGPTEEAKISQEVEIVADPGLREAVLRARIRCARETLREARAGGPPPRSMRRSRRGGPGAG